jgi:hypothetical protein
VPTVLGNVGQTFLTADERNDINKGVAHLTDKLTLDPDSEVELDAIIKRSTDVLSRLVAELRKRTRRMRPSNGLIRPTR